MTKYMYAVHVYMHNNTVYIHVPHTASHTHTHTCTHSYSIFVMIWFIDSSLATQTFRVTKTVFLFVITALLMSKKKILKIKQQKCNLSLPSSLSLSLFAARIKRVISFIACNCVYHHNIIWSLTA